MAHIGPITKAWNTLLLVCPHTQQRFCLTAVTILAGSTTRKQIMDSIDADDGYPKLVEMAREEGPDAMRALATQREWAMQLLPAA